MKYGSDVGRHRNFSYVSMYTPLNNLTQERILPTPVPTRGQYDSSAKWMFN